MAVIWRYHQKFSTFSQCINQAEKTVLVH